MNPASHPRSAPKSELDLIDVSPLVTGTDPGDEAVQQVARQIDAACRTLGFFRITGHGISAHVLAELETASREFFARAEADKAQIAMPLAGSAWRGWFPLRGEVTSGRPDRKEGLYVGAEHPPDHPRVLAGTPLHGANLFPPGPLGPAVTAWMEQLVPLAHALMRGIALGLGLPATWFEEHLTADPTVLFRSFHYPALPDNADSDEFGVGQHSDYGLLTLLAQDGSGGLQVQTPDGEWIDVPADPGVIICNLGDMLDKLTDGRYRSTPHRVRNTSGHDRLSFPFFFDPSWDAVVPTLPLDGSPPAADPSRRWDGADVQAWTGTYGSYLSAKVARVFPDLFAAVSGDGNQFRMETSSPK